MKDDLSSERQSLEDLRLRLHEEKESLGTEKARLEEEYSAVSKEKMSLQDKQREIDGQVCSGFIYIVIINLDHQRLFGPSTIIRTIKGFLDSQKLEILPPVCNFWYSVSERTVNNFKFNFFFCSLFFIVITTRT